MRIISTDALFPEFRKENEGEWLRTCLALHSKWTLIYYTLIYPTVLRVIVIDIFMSPASAGFSWRSSQAFWYENLKVSFFLGEKKVILHFTLKFRVSHFLPQWFIHRAPGGLRLSQSERLYRTGGAWSSEPSSLSSRTERSRQANST